MNCEITKCEDPLYSTKEIETLPLIDYSCLNQDLLATLKYWKQWNMCFQSIWKLRSSAKIWYPVEVNEFEVATSGGRRSGLDPGARIQAKNNLVKSSEICNFWATQTLYTSKESWKQSSFWFEIKVEDFVLKKLKKKLILWFPIPKNHNPLSVLAEFRGNLSRYYLLYTLN